MNAFVCPLPTATGIRLVVDHDGTADAVASAAADFLHALDRGDFGDLRIGPPGARAESAHIAALRETLSAFEAMRASARAA